MPITFRTTGTVSGPEFFLRAGGSLRARVRMPVACAVIERPDGLVLVDTGWSRAQCAWPEQDPGRAAKVFLGLEVRAEDALASQLISMGYDPKDVRHVVATHLHVDHVGGAVDFPNARVHATPAEWEARKRGLRGGYDARPVPFADRLELHAMEGGPALGFAASHDLFGDGAVLLLDARGHTAGSVAVGVKLDDGRWMVHVGDACMFREDYAEGSARSLYARAMTADADAQARTYAAMRAAEREHRAVLVPSHDPDVFATLPQRPEDGLRTAWDQGKKKQQQKQGGGGGNGGNGGGKAEKQPKAKGASEAT